VLIIGLLVGCNTNRHARQTDANVRHFGPSVNAPLALAALNDDEGAAAFDEFAWETSRRDHELGSGGSPFGSTITIAEIRMREHLRTSNGRPRNDSHTTSRSFQRRVGP